MICGSERYDSVFALRPTKPYNHTVVTCCNAAAKFPHHLGRFHALNASLSVINRSPSNITCNIVIVNIRLIHSVTHLSIYLREDEIGKFWHSCTDLQHLWQSDKSHQNTTVQYKKLSYRLQ